MAKRKFIVVAGQSNATAIGDAATWEDANQGLAIRSPIVGASQLSRFSESAAYAERSSLPYAFPGGPQSGWTGDGPATGTWQTPDTRGKVVSAARFLTFYNPSAACLNRSATSTTTYPGVGVVLAGSTPTRLKTSTLWQYDPQSLQITRASTGTVHTVQSGWTTPTAEITVAPAFNPPPQANETFTFVPTSGANTSGSTLRLVQQFGGISDLGSVADDTALTFAAPSAAPGAGIDAHTMQIRRPNVATEGPVTFVCKTRFAVSGQAVQFSSGDSAVVASVNTTTETITLSGANPHVVGDVVEFLASGGTLPSGLAFSTPYYVVYSVGLDIRVSTTPGGAPVNLGAGFTAPINLRLAMLPGLSAATAYYVARVGQQEQALPVLLWDSATNRVGLFSFTDTKAVSLLEGERVRLSGVLPPEFTAGVDYYVRLEASLVTSVQLATTPTGTPINFSAGGGAATLTRMDSGFMFTVSATPGGAEVLTSAVAADQVRAPLRFLAAFRGSLTGLRIRGLTGQNAGHVAYPSEVYFDSATQTSVITLATPFPHNVQAGQTFEILPPALAGQDIAFHKWAMFLPWCPFEGRAPYAGPFSVSNLAETPGNPLVLEAAASGIWPKEALRICTSGSLTSKIVPGRTYYSDVATGAAAFLAASYGGAPITGTATVTPTGGHACVLLRQEGKLNPYPPGFNYPNHYGVVGVYQPFDGPTELSAPKSAFSVGLAVALAEYYGEPMYVVPLAVTASSIAHAEYSVTAQTAAATNWFDAKQMLSWAPTETTNIFARFLDVLDATKLAFQAQGDEGECVGIVWVQGESDASIEDWAARYKVNARRLKTAMRAAIKERGLFSRPAEELRWIDPRCQTTPWPYADEVNSAKDELIAEDPYSATFDQQDLQRIAQLSPAAPLDLIHYSGAGMTELARRAYAALLSLGETNVDVEIANMALALIGEPAKVFSLDTTTDQSAQAAECAKFFAVARDTILESHSWAFATRMVVLTQTTKDTVRTDWQYAYLLPADLLNPLEVLPEGAQASLPGATVETLPWWRSSDPRHADYANGYPYAVERDASDKLVLYTNVAGARLRYNRRVTPAVQVPMKFKMAVARKLAALIAGQFVKGEAGAALAMRLDAMARAEMGDAAATDANRQQRQPWPQQMPWGRE